MAMTLSEAAARIERVADNLLPAAERTLDVMTVDGVEVGRENSSGPYSLEELARMGHPYMHGGAPPAPAGVINTQKGNFLEAWHVGDLRIRGDRITKTVVNDAPQAMYLDTEQRPFGTTFMQARPIRRIVEEALSSTIRAVALDELRKAFK